MKQSENKDILENENINKEANASNNLSSLVINKDVKKIDNGAYRDNYNLKKVKMSDSVKEIGAEAFSGCQKLKKVRLSNKLEVLPLKVFFDCRDLKEIKIPNSVVYLGDGAFKESGIRNITLPSSLVVIGPRVFSGCDKLEKITIPNSVKSISIDAFTNCFKLKKLELSKKMTKIDDRMCYYCCELETIEIPEKVKELGVEAFGYCSKLKNINLPVSLRKIGNHAFYQCHDLESISFPYKIMEIGKSAFENSGLKEVVLPSGVKKIEKRTFCNCKELERVVLPKSIKVINENAFGGCSKLTTIEMSGDTKLDDNAFYECNGVKNLIIDNVHYSIEKYKKLLNRIGDIEDIIKFICVMHNSSENIERINYGINVPLKIINNIDEEDRNQLLFTDSFKYFNDIHKAYINDTYMINSKRVNRFCKFAYNLGCFSNDVVKVRGKDVVLGQKMSVFLRQMLDDEIIEIDKFNRIFDNLELKKYNSTLVSFITEKEKVNGRYEYANFKYLMGYETAILVFILNNFNEIVENQIMTSEEKGKALHGKYVKEKIEHFLNGNSFNNIEEGDEPIVNELIKFPKIKQKHFDEAKTIMKEAKNVPNHIVGEPLKEEDEIKEKKRKIEKECIEAKKALEEIWKREFTYEWLDKHDAKNLTLGLYCDCCSSIMSSIEYGKNIMKHSIINEDMQNLILKDTKGKIIAKATIYVNREYGYAVYNDIETSLDYSYGTTKKDLKNDEEIYMAFLRGSMHFVRVYNSKNKDRPIKQVNMGLSSSKLMDIIKRTATKSEEKLPVPEFFREANYSQYVLYKKKRG